MMSLRQILFGKKFKLPLCKISELVMAYDVKSTNKTSEPRAFYALYIGLNDSGTGHQVFKLSMKKVLTTPKCKPVPMPNNVIKVVNNMGIQDKIPFRIQFHNIHHESTLSNSYADDDKSADSSCDSDTDFEQKKKSEEDLVRPTFDVDIDDNEVDDLKINNNGSDLNRNIEDIHEQENQHNHFGGPIFEEHQPNNPIAEHDENNDINEEHNDSHVIIEDELSINDEYEFDVDHLSEDENEDYGDDDYTHGNLFQYDNISDNNDTDDPISPTRMPRMLRGLISVLDGPSWDIAGAYMTSAMVVTEQAGVGIMKEYFEIEASKATPQYGFRKGLKLFGDEGYQVAKHELKANLLGRGCINMLTLKGLTWDNRKQALGYLMFLKRRCSGKMKGRGCAYSRPQLEYITKEESSSPTVSLYDLMESCLMDTMDDRKVITVDISGAFLQGEWPQDERPEYIMFEGIMVDMIYEIDPTYHDMIIWSKDCKRKFLYGRLIKVVYGTLLGAIIFYNKLSKHLTNHGFVQNKYDMCTFNKMVNGEQITVQFHVDDLKVSHKEQSVLDDALSSLRSEFGQEDKLTENTGLVHEYLGITIDYSIAGKVVFTMFDYLEDVIVEAAEDLKNSCSYYPGNDQLMKVYHDSPSLSLSDAELFHQHVARLLFASKRARPDIQVCVVFLCTRVNSPNKQDYKKLGRVISCLKETVYLSLVIGANDSGTLTWNIDASFAVHPDCKSHTGVCLTLGHGSVLSISAKQKNNTKSSTKAELVGVEDAMTFVMWMKHLFESQVRLINIDSPLKPLGSNVSIEQDNTNAIQLERNGWKSSSKRTKHINVQYFYITDKLKAGDVGRIIYKPTGDMESDFFTKALQGKAFHAHRKPLWD